MYKYSIIVGASRSGTTSLFNYLSDHPQVCASHTKQTSFFLNKNYPFVINKALYNYQDHPSRYNSYFIDCKKEAIKLEATPDYLFSKGTAEAIADSLAQNVHLIFLLRNPVERHISLYYHAKKLGFIPNDLDINKYLEKSLDVNEDAFYGRRIIDTGLYSKYIQPYLKLFSSNQLTFLFTENLRNYPHSSMKELTDSLGIDGAQYESYVFNIHNRKQDIKNKTYLSIYSRVRKLTLEIITKYPILSAPLSIPQFLAKQLYNKTNTKETTDEEITEDNMKRLKLYFSEEADLLFKLSGKRPEW